MQMGATPPTSSALAPHKRNADNPARLGNSSLLATHPGDATASDETDGSDSAGQVLHAEEVSPSLVLPKHRLSCCWHIQSMCWHCWVVQLAAWLLFQHSPSMLICLSPAESQSRVRPQRQLSRLNTTRSKSSVERQPPADGGVITPSSAVAASMLQSFFAAQARSPSAGECSTSPC